MPFEPGLSRSWYIKGRVAARTGKWADMYEAWHSAKGKPTISGKRVTAQESFFQGYIDVPQKNPATLPAQIRRLPSGEIQLKLSLKGAHAKQQAQAIRKALGKRVKSALITGGKLVHRLHKPRPTQRRKR